MKPTSDDGSDARPPHSSSAEAERSGLDWAREMGESDRVVRELDQYLARRRRRRLALAGASLVVLLMGGVVWRSQERAPIPVGKVTTDAVVLRAETQRLPDGTTVELKSGAEIAFDFSGGFRRVSLRQGEAHFQVAKDPQHPFIVSAGGVNVRAVGTAFSVQLGRAAVDVLITEGHVGVKQDPAANAPSLSVSGEPPTPLDNIAAGNRVIVDLRITDPGYEPPKVVPVSSAEIDERLAWRVPRLEFVGTPLAQAIPMFNQYGRVHLVLSDPSLGALQLSGRLRVDDTEPLLRLLEREFGIKAVSQGDQILLSRQ